MSFRCKDQELNCRANHLCEIIDATSADLGGVRAALATAQKRIEELEAALQTSAELVGSFEAGIRLTREVHSRTLAVALETMHAALGEGKP